MKVLLKLSMFVILVALVLAANVWAVTYKTIYKFTGKADGNAPYAGLIRDRAGNLYGTTFYGGSTGWGTVFELTPNADSTWTETVLYSFKGTPDGQYPDSILTFDRAGNLYGMTWDGGVNGSYNGAVFELSQKSDGSWREKIIHSFLIGVSDCGEPHGGVIFDSAGNLYGTAKLGGANGWGGVFKLSPNSDGSWTEQVIYSFGAYPADAIYPVTGLVFDQAGNLYGTSVEGGTYNDGTVFKLAPNGNGTWTESVLHSFLNSLDGWEPDAGLVFDQQGNLYGTTIWGGTNGIYNGLVFELSPNGDGTWSETVLHSFNGSDGSQSQAQLAVDHNGNLYGTTLYGGANSDGVVFRLDASNGWQETWRSLVNAHPIGSLLLDANGIFGTTQGDGRQSFGTVFQITP